MGNWECIFKEYGKIYSKPQEDMRSVIKTMKKAGVKRILDLGCGSGRHTVMLAKAGFDVYGMDSSATGLKLARRWLKESGLSARLKKASCYKRFPFRNGFFDAAISIQVFHHNYHKYVKFCISEIERVLRPGGIAFVTFPSQKRVARATKFKIVEPHTYILLDEWEKGLLHFIYNKALLKKDFRNFRIVNIRKDSRNHWCLLGVRK